MPALVISLDFELHWGIRDHTGPYSSYRANLLGVRQAVPALLDLFAQFGIRATWATVGFLFAQGRTDMRRYFPSRIPRYVDSRLDPYGEPVGDDEASDPIHFAPSLLQQIRLTSGQEIGTHTFSHYYCLEAGQTAADFRADLNAAVSIASANGVRLRSIAFPRNQHNPAYDRILVDAGIECYRGPQSGFVHEARPEGRLTTAIRARRFLETYAGPGGPAGTAWGDVRQSSGLCNLPASVFLRPYSASLRALEPLRLHRIAAAMEDAARQNRVFHVWWHPHNFGTSLAQNIGMLRGLLERFSVLREQYGMQSFSMADAAEYARGIGASE